MKSIKLILSFFLTLAASSMMAQQPEEMQLWPNNQAASEAKLFVYHPKITETPAPAILICPGGGYGSLAIDNEGYGMAKWYVKQGFVAVVLKYRMPRGVRTIPLSDAEEAMKTIRKNAKKWNLDPNRVGIVGSSAGGHLAASVSTLAADENRPNFAILYYPVISFDDAITHAGTKKNLLGSDINNKELVEHYTLQNRVDAKTPKTLLLLPDDDKTVPPINSVLYYEALKAQHIPAAMYIFPNGSHGFGSHETFEYNKIMWELIAQWLKHIEILK